MPDADHAQRLLIPCPFTRLQAQPAMIENGSVHLPAAPPWLAEYLHELATFPNSRYDDRADPTARVLDWAKEDAIGPG